MIYNSDGSQADVMAKVALATTGDTVTLPAGVFTGWGYGFVAVNLSVPMNLIGAGSGSTTIVLDSSGPNGNYGTIQFMANAMVSGMTISGSSSNDVNPFAAYVGGTPNSIRITSINYQGRTSAAYFFIGQSAGGVIDNCSIIGGAGNAELIFLRGPTDAWQAPDSFGSANALYIENNTFGGQGYVCDVNANARAVVRYNTITVPGMKIDAHGMDSNSPARSFRQIEVYRNTFTNGGAEAIAIRGAAGILFDNSAPTSDPSSTWFQLIDYGSISPWPNYGVTNVSATSGNPTIITTSIPHGYASGWLVYVNIVNSDPGITGFYTGSVLSPTTFSIPVNVSGSGMAVGSNWTARERTPYDYPTYDQVGRGMDTGAVYTNLPDPMYLWNNTTAGGADWTLNWKAVDANAITLYREQTANPSATFTMQDMIAADRDYFKQTVGVAFNGSGGVGTGTFAQMNAITPTKTGVGFWVVDQGSWNKTVPAGTAGQLYTYSGGWNLAYTPYQYPFYWVNASGGTQFVYKRYGPHLKLRGLAPA